MRQEDFAYIDEFRSGKPQWEELGFDFGKAIGSVAKIAAPIAGGLIGGPIGASIGGSISGALGGKPKSKSPTQASQEIDLPVSSIPSENTALVSLVATLPNIIREQVRAAIAETQAERGTVAQAQAKIASSVNQQFMPQIKTILKSLALAQTQRDVTSEHNSLVAEKNYKDNTTKALNTINSQMADLRAHLNGAKIIRNKRVINILGGTDFLESLNR
jgi:hypothetical protein